MFKYCHIIITEKKLYTFIQKQFYIFYNKISKLIILSIMFLTD